MTEIASTVYLGAQGPPGAGISNAQFVDHENRIAAVEAAYVGHATVDDHVMPKVAHQQAADVVSTTNGATFVDGMATTLTLAGSGADTWTVRVVGTLALKHSASGAAVMRCRVEHASNDNGTDMTTQALSSTVYGRWEAAHTVASVAGGQAVTFRVQYHSGDVGTTSAANPSLAISAVRNT